MSEESDCSSDANAMIVHALPRRSQGKMLSYILLYNNFVLLIYTALNHFIQKLDERHENRIHKQGMLMARKNKISGSVSSTSCSPPPDPPAWTIYAEWRKSECIHKTLSN